MIRKLSVTVFFTLLIASFTFSFFLPSLLGLPRTGLNAQTVPSMPGIPRVPIMIYRKSTLPKIANHIASAQARGQRRLLRRITNPRLIAQNRRAACRGFVRPNPPNTSCDEYPFASTVEGGTGASTRGVPPWEQNVQGGIISSFYRVNSIQNGDRFRVRVLP